MPDVGLACFSLDDKLMEEPWKYGAGGVGCTLFAHLEPGVGVDGMYAARGATSAEGSREQAISNLGLMFLRESPRKSFPRIFPAAPNPRTKKKKRKNEPVTQ